MAMLKLTATKIDKHKPVKNDENLADGNGLYLRFRKGQSGMPARVWMYTYKIGTRSVYMTLGEHEASLSDFDQAIYKLPVGARLTLETARKITTELADWRQRGLDPKAFLQSEIERLMAEFKARDESALLEKKKVEVEKLAIRDLFDAWLADGVRRQDGNLELVRSFNADVLPKIGKLPVKDLTEHELRGILRAMVKRGVNRSAVAMRNNLMQMFAWAERRQPWRKLLVDGNPMELIEIEKIVSPDFSMNNARDRILSAEEIRELRDIFDRLGLEYDGASNKRIVAQPIESTTQRAIWIMLSTVRADRILTHPAD